MQDNASMEPRVEKCRLILNDRSLSVLTLVEYMPGIQFDVGICWNYRCRICLLEFRNEDVVRQLPHCDHVFHRHCIDPVLGKRRTCPVCSARVVIDGLKASENLSGSNAYRQQIPLRTIYSDGPSSPTSPREPSWILVNQPVPLPRSALVTSSSSSERFEIELNPSDSIGNGDSPLLKHRPGSHVQGWNDDDDLEKCIDISFNFSGDIPVEKRQQICGFASTNEKGVDSFSFGTARPDAFTFPGLGGHGLESSDAAFRSPSRRSGGQDSSSSSDFIPSTRHSRSTSRSSRTTNSSSDSSFKQQMASWDYGHSQPQEASEYNAAEHLPLTRSPDQCFFDMLPVITSSGNHILRPPLAPREPLRVGSYRNSYSQL